MLVVPRGEVQEGKCPVKHRKMTEEERRAHSRSPSPGNKKEKCNPWTTTGVCRYGDQGRFAHVTAAAASEGAKKGTPPKAKTKAKAAPCPVHRVAKGDAALWEFQGDPGGEMIAAGEPDASGDDVGVGVGSIVMSGAADVPLAHTAGRAGTGGVAMSDAIPPALIAVSRPGPARGEAMSLAAAPIVAGRLTMGRLARLTVGPVDVTLYEIEPYAGMMGCKTSRRRDVPAQQHLSRCDTTQSEASALCDAKELAFAVGYDIQYGWPIVWSKDGTAYLFEPHLNGDLHIDKPSHPEFMNHSAAKRAFGTTASSYLHLGDAVPVFVAQGAPVEVCGAVLR